MVRCFFYGVCDEELFFVDLGQAQPGAFAHFLGVEEGLEDMRLCLFIYGAAIIAHA